MNAQDALNKGLTIDQFAAKQAETWRKGLADWDSAKDTWQLYKLDNDFARNIAANRAGRERIMARSRALAVQNEAFRSNIMTRHRAAMDTSSHDRFIAGIHESSSHDRYIDSIHDVETFHDPQWGTSKHGYARQHWTDGSGNYIHSDDLNHDPNIGSQVEWTQMERVR